jgi:hypothetical protein
VENGHPDESAKHARVCEVLPGTGHLGFLAAVASRA